MNMLFLLLVLLVSPGCKSNEVAQDLKEIVDDSTELVKDTQELYQDATSA